MSVKTRIKNDFWRWNYILPFVKKHQFDEKGKNDVIKKVISAYLQIRPIKAYGFKRSVGGDTKAILSKVNIEISKDSHFVYFIDETKTIAVPGNILSNFTLDYDRIIHGTFQELVDRAIGSDEYGKEAQAVADGIVILIERIIRAIVTSDLSEDVKEKQKNIFEKMLKQPARHFDEALQRILFFNQVMWQTRHRLNGLGRLDKILDDIYKKDIQDNVLTLNEASQIVGDFLFQLSRYSDYKSDALEGDIGQIVILGGLNTDGSYFCNDLTKIFLEEQAKLGKPDPKTFLRVSKSMPDDLLKISVNCLISKTGSPLFSNDDVVIPALLDFGIPEIDAYNYCVSACWEPFIVGKSLDQNNIAVFDYFNALDEVLNQASYSSFDELLNAYIYSNEENFRTFLNELNKLKWAKDPLVSMFNEDCSKKRIDISEGSTLYNNYGITTVALSNVVDSLLNIKKLVFDTKKYTLSELNQLRLKNYEGEEETYNYIKQSKKFFGHDDMVTIELVNKITSSISNVSKAYRNQYGGTVKFGLSSPAYNILSKKTGADMSGRKTGMPYSTHISCLDAPYTEVVSFASQLSYDKQRFNGNVIDFFVSPGFLSENIDKFNLFMKGAINAGFFQMQMNIMDSKTLIDAKAHPENYAGLIVRVWGFSAYFNDLPESYKDLLIERALSAEKQE